MNRLLKLISFLSILYLINLLPKCLSNDVIGCGGFVKSIVNINYNKIVIKLLTNKGIVKYSTDCAPNNGYYFIPLYDKGLYQLKIEPPNGWTFDPMAVDLNFDGKTDLCSKQNDINFSFKGFTVSGRVFSEGSNSGPSGVSITLRAKTNNNVLKTTLTSDDGIYEFKEVLPGDYIIDATHHSWRFKKSELQISVVDDNIDVSNGSENNLSILGYEVIGNVMSEGEPIHSVHFALFSKTRRSLLGCDSKQIPIKIPKDGLVYLCHVLSDQKGLFRFPTVPVGSYVLVPFYGANNIKFDVKPKELDFEILNENIKIETVFQIEGFSVSGKIVVQQKGIPNAEINFRDQNTGHQMTVTSQSDGVYTLENVKTGNYMISVTARHMHFEPVSVKISPISAIIPEISPNAFDVCGSFVLKSSQINTEVTILFKSNKYSESITTDLSDGFCLPLRPDTYTISQISSDKKFQLIESQTTVTVKSEPILNLKFTQFTATLTGRVITKDSANDLQLKMFNKFDNQLTKNLMFSDLKKLSANKFEFKINNVLPGSYRLSISRDTDSWCWLSDTHSVDVIDKDVSDIEFVQKGYILSLFFSHIIDFDLKYPSNKLDKLRVGSDHSLKHCVTETGIYMILPKGCHKFSETENEAISFDSSKDSGKLISRTAVKHLVSANVITNLNVTDIVLTVKFKSFGNEEFTQRIQLEQKRVIKTQNDLNYEYLISIWSKPMVNLYLEPSSGQLLFKPNSYETRVENECLENAITFNGKIGLFINGQITNKLDNVIIKIMSSDQLLLTTKTDSLGKYIAGPFDSDIQLTISAEKEGYFFKGVDKKLGHFDAIRLSKITVRVSDDNKEPLSDVLISISGGTENYRKNSVTPNTGQLTFNNLHSGEYFLRVMMKEYDFEPSSQMMTVSDGSDLNIEVRAKKVAFSCIGVTDSLNGEPEPGVVVEAIGLRNIVMNSKYNCSQLQEEAISEANGSFRIRGLRPECQYAIRIKSNDERNKPFNQTIPRIHLIRVEDRDVTNVRLIIFRKSTQMDVSGDVITPFEHLPSLKVRLFSELNPDQPIQTIGLTYSPFFFLPALNIDNRNYFIRLESSLSTNLYEFETQIKSFRANTSHLHLTLTFSPKSKLLSNSNLYTDHDVGHGSGYMLAIIIIVGTAIYNRSKLYPLLAQFLNFVNRFNTERLVNNSDNSNISLFSVKRKTKSKKI